MASVTERLDALECHFTWLTEDHMMDQSASNLIKYLTIDITKDSNDIETLARPFMAFLYAQGDEPDWDSALKECIKAVELCWDFSTEPDTERQMGYELVALSNKAHIQQALEDKDGLAKTFKQIDSLEEKRKDNDKMNASILGMHGFALSHLGNNYPESMGLFREAEDLDPGNFHWPLGRGLVAGRLYRREKQVNPKSSVLNQLDLEQEESLLRAVELTGGTHYISLLHLADVYYWRGRGNAASNWTKDWDLFSKAKKFYLKVYDMNPDCPALLKRIGKAFPEMDKKEEPFAEECLLRAEELDPRNSMLLHRLGQFYEHCQGPKRDFAKAEKYYMEAVTSGTSRNLPAEMDLGRVRRKIDRKYDFRQHLTDLLEVYPGDEHQIILQNRLRQLDKQESYRNLERSMRNLRVSK